MGSTGVIIAAASHRVAQPFTRLGGVSFIQRLTLTYRKAGVRTIVVVTGFEDPDIKAVLTGEGVVFCQLADFEDPQLIESFRIGLDYLADKCERIFLTPVNAPMYTHATIEAMLASPGDIVIPSFGGKAGHPVLVDRSMADAIAGYEGPDGLAGFVRSSTADRRWIDVTDEGVLYTVHQMADLNRLMAANDESLIQPAFSLSIRKARTMFDARSLLLLRLIDEFGSVSGACRSMSLSLTRAWRLINDLEADLGFDVVHRSQGGHRGGKTRLTDSGRAFVDAYEDYNARVDEVVSRGFRDFWTRVAPLVVPRGASAPD